MKRTSYFILAAQLLNRGDNLPTDRQRFKESQNCHNFALVVLAVLVSLLLAGCQKPQPGDTDNAEISVRDDLFAYGVALGKVVEDDVEEASGLVASQEQDNLFWTHNDSGDRARIFALSKTGDDRGTFNLKGVDVEDVEDITRHEDTLFLADIGDNDARRSQLTIYRFPEPRLDAEEDKIEAITPIRFRYPEGARDAETLMYDPLTDSLFIVTKRERQVRLYRLPAQVEDTDEVLEAEWLLEMPFRMIVAGDISADGMEVLLKTYNEVLYWKRQPNEPLAVTLSREPYFLPYETELQGESIAWEADGSAFFTLSEERDGTIEAEMVRYVRK